MAPTHVQTVSVEDGAGGISSLTYTNLAVGSGSNRSLVAYVLWFDLTGSTPSGSSVVFNTSENFTYRTRTQYNWGGNNYGTVEIWTLDNPSNATANVVATWDEVNDAADTSALIISEYTGANNGVGTNFGSGTGTNQNPTCTFTTGLATSLICAAFYYRYAGDLAYTPGTDTTERLEDFIAASLNYWAGDEPATGASNTIDASTTGSVAISWGIAAIELKAAAGAAAYTIDVSDGITLGDTPTIDPLILGNVQVSDGITLGDTPTMELNSFITAQEDLTVGDTATIDPLILGNVQVSDGITLGDTAEITPLLLGDVNVSDGITLGDTATVVQEVEGEYNINVSDGVTLGDNAAITPLLLGNISVSDGLTLEDTAIIVREAEGEYNVNVSDGVSLGDTAIVVREVEGEYNINVSDGVTLGDIVTLTPLVLGNVSVSDGLTVGDTATVSIAAIEDLVINVTDALTFGDAVTITPLILGNVVVSDAITLADAVTAAVVAGDIYPDPTHITAVLFRDKRTAVLFRDKRTAAKFRDRRADSHAVSTTSVIAEYWGIIERESITISDLAEVEVV